MNTRIIFNTGIYAAAVVVFFVLFFVSIFFGGTKRKTDKYFAILIFFYFFALLSAFAMYMYRLFGDHNQLIIKILYSVMFSFIYCASYVTLAYCFSYFRASHVKAKKIIRWITFPLFATFGVLGLLGTIYDKLFIIQKDVIVLNQIFIGLYVFFCAMSLLSFFVTFIKTKKSFLEFFSFTLLTIGIPVALLFEYLYIDTGVFGLALITFFLIHFLLYYIDKDKHIAEQEKLLHEQQTSLLISQIQPHFIYNCLSSISYLCQIDGKKASEAIDDFSKYLRMNFSAINRVGLVPFETELEYINVYLKLEKLRFGDRVKVQYSLKAKSFFIPCLTIQPLVENAVKHGITKKIKGGVVKIKTLETKDDIIIIVSDNGVGFTEETKKDDRVHLGLSNTKSRVEQMCGGKVEYVSVPKKGVTVTITLPKANVTKIKVGGTK